MDKERYNCVASNRPIEYIEIHDAWLDRIALYMNGRGVIKFRHLPVYHRIGHEKYEIWSYRAEVSLEGINKCQVVGQLKKDDYILDGKVTDRTFGEIEWSRLLMRSEVEEIVLQFQSGTSVLMKLSSAMVHLGTPLGRLEYWNGPLHD